MVVGRRDTIDHFFMRRTLTKIVTKSLHTFFVTNLKMNRLNQLKPLQESEKNIPLHTEYLILMIQHKNSRKGKVSQNACDSIQPTENQTPTINLPESMLKDCSMAERELYLYLASKMNKYVEPFTRRSEHFDYELKQYEYCLEGGLKALKSKCQVAATSRDLSNMLRNLENRGYIRQEQRSFKDHHNKIITLTFITVLYQNSHMHKKATREDIIAAFGAQNQYDELDTDCWCRFNMHLSSLVDEHDRMLKEHDKTIGEHEHTISDQKQQISKLKEEQAEDRKHLYEVEGYCKYLENELNSICCENEEKYGRLSARLDNLEKGGSL